MRVMFGASRCDDAVADMGAVAVSAAITAPFKNRPRGVRERIFMMTLSLKGVMPKVVLGRCVASAVTGLYEAERSADARKINFIARIH